MDICRAITFINYHIPMVIEENMEIQYTTVGFFDGMLTERLEIHYGKYELKQLWKYGLKRTAKSMGQYSYQNIFCFSQDEWNKYTDEFFWEEDTNKEYPLTFVVFLQLREYRGGDNNIEAQCRKFNRALDGKLNAQGIYYSYGTIDKNDFVICLKCRDYKNAVEAIKCLHSTGGDVVYSYSVFSVSNTILEELESKKYNYVFEQYVDSICLKGITNSYDPQQKVTLDKKYYEFCTELVTRLYEGQEDEADDLDYRLYDILGDDDFRLIARDVKLGILLQQFGKGGMLCYREKKFRFYLFSSNLILNTLTPEYDKIEEGYFSATSYKMEQKFQAPICNQLQRRMQKIAQMVLEEADEVYINEKVVTFSHAIWQLLQSLKVLEMAPTKKYDFWSLYRPLSLMIEILENKMSAESAFDISKRADISENAEIYNFIHKISMTLHGTLRTDIQFFQIRDFNVIVHYAPAKLRAFYALWALQLSDYYNDFCDDKNQYSFVCSPGMFRETGVKQLFTNYDETKRLMLITVPERHLYAPRWLSVILAHEVSHFVGYTVRNREVRHNIWLECCARVLFLEMNCYRYNTSPSVFKTLVEDGVKDSKFFEDLKEQLKMEEQLFRHENPMWPHEFHSNNSFKIIKKAFGNVARSYIKKFVIDDSERMNIFLKEGIHIDKLPLSESVDIIEKIRRMSNEESQYLLALYQKFQFNMLAQLLNIFRYITTEAYADLTAILTLNLTPLAYILSFSKGELNFNVKEADAQEGLLLIVRAGIVINAVENIVKSRHEIFEGTSFSDEWSESVAVRLAQNADVASAEGRLILEIYGYITGKRNCNNNISTYKSLYNFSNNVEDFTNTELDFFNDKIIWDLIMCYMDKCAEDYIKILFDNSKLVQARKEITKTYEKISGDSAVDVMQEIENFLVKHEATENDRVKNCKVSVKTAVDDKFSVAKCDVL